MNFFKKDNFDQSIPGDESSEFPHTRGMYVANTIKLFRLKKLISMHKVVFSKTEGSYLPLKLPGICLDSILFKPSWQYKIFFFKVYSAPVVVVKQAEEQPLTMLLGNNKTQRKKRLLQRLAKTENRARAIMVPSQCMKFKENATFYFLLFLIEAILKLRAYGVFLKS